MILVGDPEPAVERTDALELVRALVGDRRRDAHTDARASRRGIASSTLAKFP